jgi:hypothetical protein
LIDTTGSLISTVAATAELFLKIREAHDQRREIVVEAPF